MSKLPLLFNLPVEMDVNLRRELEEIFQGTSNVVNRMTHDWTTITTVTSVAHDLVLVDATLTTTVTVNLPKAKDWEDALLRVKKINSDTGKVIITPNGTETIDEVGSQTIHTQYTCLQLFSDGKQWWIV